MAYDMKAQMNCCIACGSPVAPDKDVLRLQKVGSRSLMYIERKIMNDWRQWGIARNTEVNLLSEQHGLHTVHLTNSLPVVDHFFTGSLVDFWADDDTPGFAFLGGAAVAAGAAFSGPHSAAVAGGQPAWFYFRSPDGSAGDEWSTAIWPHINVQQIPGFQLLRQTIDNCLNRINGIVRVQPDPSFVVGGCKSCNDIMTQESTMRHLLVRNVVNRNPLVPLNMITRYNLRGGDPGKATSNPVISTGVAILDPNAGTRNGLQCSFQAAIAFYIHRCLPNRPVPLTAWNVAAREFYVLFAYILLEVASLQFERYHGTRGGAAKRTKPEFHYRGVAELYTSYMFYLLLSNDVAIGEPNNGRGMLMDFAVFHKYFFGELHLVFITQVPQMATYTEILDMIYTPRWYAGNNPGFVSTRGTRMAMPEQVIGYMATRVSYFYENYIRPCFSRHFTALVPQPLPPGLVFAALNANTAFEIQKAAKKTLISRQNLDTFLHLCDRAADGDIDSFMNHVGVHAVMNTLMEMLRNAPEKVFRMMSEFVDAWTLYEYVHIYEEMNLNPVTVKVSRQTAECVYLLCNSLEDPVVPINDTDIQVLRESPKCSAYLGALRLDLAGAFRTEDDPE